MKNRRIFILHAGLGAAAAALSVGHVFAQTAMLSETDPQAAALAYKVDAAKTDKVKFPKYAAGQNCASCALYQAKAGDKAGGCPLFAGKQVAANAWCSAYVKKA